ncbi:MAG: hypothetical protein E7386_04815 [Ruminococcaceae bacterium]|nr:hypothetical protein [Oscillospiraceae bacterium]
MNRQLRRRRQTLMRTEIAIQVEDKKSSKFITALASVAISVITAAGFTAMVDSSFGIGFRLRDVIMGPLVIAAVFAVLYSLKPKWISFVALSSAPVLFTLCVYFDWFDVKQGLYALLFYLKMYVFLWMPGDFPEAPDAARIVLVFFIAYNLISVGVSMFVLMKRTFIPAAVLFYMPMFLFSVMNTDIPPKATPFLISLTGVLLIMISHAFRDKKHTTYNRMLVILIVPVFIFMLLLGGIFPQKKYNKDKLAQRILIQMRNRVEKVAGRDNPLRELLEKALNGLENTDYDDSFDTISPLYATSTNLTNVGPFNPSTAEVLRIYRSRNPNYTGLLEPYEGNVLYLKVESMDTYQNNTLSASRIKGNAYNKKVEPVYEPAQYGVTVTPLRSASVDIVPYYSDYYDIESGTRKRLNALTSTREHVSFFGSANVPVRTGNIYSEKYLNDYVYKTCLAVPYSTDRSIMNCDEVPIWFKDLYNGVTEMSDAEKVRKVTEYVRNLHPYSVNTPYPPRGVDFVPWFIKDANSGICVHYAVTSMVLLRMLGVPTRYVRGYIDMNSGMDKESTVYANQAHAWFEFFTPEYGWVMGDATPGYNADERHFNIDAIANVNPDVNNGDFRSRTETSPEETTSETETETETSEETTTAGPDSTTTPESENASESDQTTQTMVLPDGETVYVSGGPVSPGDSGQAGKFVLPDSIKNFFKLVLTIVIIVTVVAVIVFLGRAVFVIYWNSKFSAKTVNGRALACYHYFALMGRIFKVPVPSGASELAEKARFSGRSLSHKEYDALISACKNALKNASSDFSRYKKYAYRLLKMRVPGLKPKEPQSQV